VLGKSRGVDARHFGLAVEVDTRDRGAALAYYFVFALFPALLFMTSLLGLLPFPRLMDTLMAYISQALPVTPIIREQRRTHRRTARPCHRSPS